MIGIDITETARIKKSLENPGFLRRVFTASEIAYYESRGRKAETLAGIFCAKEAVVKALGTGFIKSLAPADVEILHTDSGAPYAVVAGIKFDVSISHNRTTAVAVCAADAPSAVGFRDSGDYILLAPDTVKLPPRRRVSNKYDYGKTVIIGGSKHMPGAVKLSFSASRAVLRSGGGLCVLAVPGELLPAYSALASEQMLFGLSSRGGEFVFDEREFNELLQKTDAVAIGPGMPPSDGLARAVDFLAHSFDGTLILDAGALSVLAKRPNIVDNHICKLILTPHAGEFARLDSIDKDDTDGDNSTAATPADGGGIPVITRVKNAAKRFNAVVVYKADISLITDGGVVYLNTSGTPTLAKGGSGDILSGIIAAFSKRLPPLFAAALGSYTLGKSAESAQKKLGSIESVLAGDVILELPDL
ncbi:MAG: NAD(P)H-hydrate dehydratase [Clostridiales bacterium]|jgi:NAD(P)H-hydrate epimerase|nr:NAD(P)H-hydrate dehydratase [Clostridiales bacterium]